MKAAIIGGGVIGGGWAARFLLNGWDVAVFDPDPNAPAVLDAVLKRARAALPGLLEIALPERGELSFCDTMHEAVAGADWVQESVPERIEVKRDVYQKLQALIAPEAILASSTSGFKPSELQSGAAAPEQIIVAHPFNPVYLMPLVELVSTDANAAATIDRAADILRGVGMYPLKVRKEIDAHIADRFLEAVWREALWLIKDDVTALLQPKKSMRRSAWGLGYVGLRWGCSKPIAARAARMACATLWRSLARR